MTRSRLLAFDLVAVLAFVVIGRRTHDETNAIVDVVRIALPFVMALSVGWAVTWRRLRPTSVRAGLVCAAMTTVLGMGIRWLVFDDGIALPFVAVATGFLTASMIGWRLLAARFESRPTPD